MYQVRQLCARHDVDYFGLESENLDAVSATQCEVQGEINNLRHPLKVTDVQEIHTPGLLEDPSERNLGTTYTVLVSQRVTSRSGLLVALETHYNMLVVERNFAHLSGANRHFADVILDECNAIVIEPMTSLKGAGGTVTDVLKQKVSVLSLKYENVWLVLENGDSAE